MTTNHHPTTSLTWRLILARCDYDPHAEQLVSTEVPHTHWRQIADSLLDVAAMLLADRSGAGIRLVERQIALAMYCEQRDRDDLPLDVGIIGRQIGIWDAFDQERAS
jgi:hypothetical protein